MITVLGSINVDMVTRVERRPLVGETVSGLSFDQFPGGKGANQAVAAAKLGLEVHFLGMIGQDAPGEFVGKSLQQNGVITDAIEYPATNTGVAAICVDTTGANNIVVVPGANGCVDVDYVHRHQEVIANSKAILSQFETPIDATLAAFQLAKSKGVTTILNPAPAMEVPPELVSYVDILVPNEFELEQLTGVATDTMEGIDQAVDCLFQKGVQTVVVTLGSRGAYLATKETRQLFPAFPVKAVDTTAAGDSFLGGFIASYLQTGDMAQAITQGQQVASYAVQRPGAQPSMPTAEELAEYIQHLRGAK